MDITQLSQLPLTVLVILGAYWVIQRHDAEYQRKLIELIAQFSEKYLELVKRADQEREEARQRWMERDRLLIETLVGTQKAMSESALQDHALRSTLAPLVLWWETERARLLQRQSGGKENGAD